ncbi:hypothetical protein J5N97_021568 [Dioscorea zingiberensis]|uniref:Uncharacterized protein n=1 Tax=Dioscorea zingiberensis TaxID=325984 RepID=A0A9D5C8V9_9LILI|nr:hypothetical protein J5N97_021568 [Dioscorea zingiberensis]
MAALKLLLVSIAVLALALAIVGASADSGVDAEVLEAVEVVGEMESPLKLEIERLKSQIEALESRMSDKAREVKSKSEIIQKLEQIIEEKSVSIASLSTEIELLQKKGVVDAEELVGKAHARAREFEKQVEHLKSEIEAQSRIRNALEDRLSEAEKKVQELNLKSENQNKMNDELKHKLQKTERALKVAEEELMRVQLETRSKAKELTEIRGAWLPHWLAVHMGHCQDRVAAHWDEHGKPAMNLLLQKASEKSAQAHKWAEPHLEVAKTKWIPAAKERWVTFTTHVEPYVQKVSTKTIQIYEVSKSTVTPQIVKVKELADPYVQKAREISKPYIEQVAIITKPHVEKVRVVMKPYTKRAVYAYGEFLKSATTYHHQVQTSVQEKLKKHDLTKHLATKEFVWFVASALLALPVLFLFKLLSMIFCKKTMKPTANGHRSHPNRRPKRRHAEK